jgi:hypothetical protein
LEEELALHADRLVGGAKAFLIIDDTAPPKKGAHSVGVAPQYASVLGKNTNCAALLVDERRDQTEMRVDARRPTVSPTRSGGRTASLLLAGAPAISARRQNAKTPKRSAACRRDMPAATAETTRSRRSSERVFFDMHASLLRQQAA